MHFLLSTIDGTTNPGFVAALRYLEQISGFPDLKGVEGYPVGMHYVASWFADLLPSSSGTSSLATVQAFAATILVVYALIIAQVGQLTRDLCKATNLRKSSQLISALASQLLFLTPFFIQNLLMLYSLAFLGALSVALTMFLFLLKRQKESVTENTSRGGIVISLGLMVISVSYPTFLLVGFFFLLIYLFQPSISHFFQISVRTPAGKYVPVLMSFCLSILTIQLFTAVINQFSAFSPNTSTRVSRFSLTGHLIALDGLLVLLTSLFAFLCASVFYWKKLNEAKSLFLFLIPVLTTVIGSWLLSDSLDRSYGLNYYAKKSEYQLVVLLAPLAFCGFFQVIELLTRYTRTLSATRFILPFLAMLITPLRMD